MKSLSEIEDTIRDFAYELFLANAGCSRKQLADFHAHGIPEEWARQFAKEIAALPVEDWPKLIPSPHVKKVARNRLQRGNIEPEMHTEQRLAISRSGPQTPWKKAITAKRYTQNSLAKKVGISPTLLSLCVKGKRSIKRSIADRIDALIEWPATKAKWPGGISEE